MAIYHFSAKIVSRTHGRSIIAAAAYRAGTRLREDSTNITYDYTHKPGVEHTEILAPNNAPGWARDRSQLWNAVDHIEKRKDSQLARDLEIALPVELDKTAQVELLRDFVQHHLVHKGMIADCAIHRDNPNNPHAHVLLTLRRIGPKGFGLKERSWNEKSRLEQWRLGWAEVANQHFARAGLAVRIDHRTLQAQGLDLIPGRKIGVSLERQQSDSLPLKIADRVAEQRSIASENGELIIADPNVAIKALTHYQGTFTEHDISRFLNTRTGGADQFRNAYLKVTTSPELVVLGIDDRGRKRYTELIEVHHQTTDWQQEATSQLETGATKEALCAYEREGSIVQTTTRDRARSDLIDEWSLDAQQKPDQTRLILAYTQDDVRKLNELARSVRRKRHELGHSEKIETERGTREFAMNDRLHFLRNEHSLNVKNGTLGTITGINNGVLQVRLDNTHQQITVDTRFHRDLDHGYAATVHKAQGTTVDRTYILATSHLDRHATYVALTRHREGTSMFYAAEDFGRAGVSEGHIDLEAKQQFLDILSRAAPKELAHDCLDRDNTHRRSVMDEIDAMRQRGADAWLEKQLAREQDPSRDQENQSKDRHREDRGLEDDFGL